MSWLIAVPDYAATPIHVVMAAAARTDIIHFIFVTP
jgi:hypothetical protein